jgi:glycosyltransferase involved in cell wall biosynthesis
MKIIQVPFCFAPDPVGGTEIYVSALARNLKLSGEDVIVAAPGKDSGAYVIDDLQVRRFAISHSLSLSHLYGLGDPIAAAEFEKILDEINPDIVHMHAFTAAVSILIVYAAKKRNIPVIFTYHTPTASCQRGTLMRWGTEVCDGELEVGRCTACTLQGGGVPRALASSVGKLPPKFGAVLETCGLRGGAWTALQMSHLLDVRQSSFRNLIKEVDHFVAVCDWVRSVLLINQVPFRKVTLSRQGIEWDRTGTTSSSSRCSDGELRVAFVGRLDPTKGLHVLINAIREVATSAIKLDVYGVVQSEENEKYKREILGLAKGDNRIRFQESIPSDLVVGTMREYDVVAVPSQWLETGPLVVLEAFAAGTPVIGSNIGGMAELVRDGVNGLLVSPNLVNDWSKALTLLASDTTLREELRAGVRPPRTSADVADEMLALYKSIL